VGLRNGRVGLWRIYGGFMARIYGGFMADLWRADLWRIYGGRIYGTRGEYEPMKLMK
jgi:hypothetical protein